MQQHEQKWFFMHFENKFLTFTRELFQAWFVEIMELAYPGDFTGTRQGTYKGGGDLNCDGFRSSTGTVYAVYAPRDCGLKELNDKIVSDFQSAEGNFGTRMKEWIFVHNDEQSSAETIRVLCKLAEDFPHVRIGQFMKKNELWEVVRTLPPDKLNRLLTPFPEQEIVDRLGFKELQPILHHLEKHPPPMDLPIDAPSPEKLAHNSLSVESEDWLKIGRRKERLVGSYFEGTYDPELGEKIAQAFRDRYQRLKQAKWLPDQILEDLYGFAGGFKFLGQTEQAAILTVLTYFFEKCDIFDNEPARKTT